MNNEEFNYTDSSMEVVNENDVTIMGEKKNKTIIGVIVVLVIAVLTFLFGPTVMELLTKENEKPKEDEKQNEVIEIDMEKYSKYAIKSNSIDDFDLRFLKLENNEVNKIYSPLSIKYALSMLNEGTDKVTNAQIKGLIGEYKYKKYTNSKNLSIANALFVQNDYKDDIKEEYTTTLKENYNAEVVYDSFKNVKTLNKWVKTNTLNLIDKAFDNVSDSKLILTNVLAIDMEWNKKIKSKTESFIVDYKNENFNFVIHSLEMSGYDAIKFNGSKKATTKALQIGAAVNKYDIITELGENTIREEVKREYTKWLEEYEADYEEEDEELDDEEEGGEETVEETSENAPLREKRVEEGTKDVDAFVDQYIKDLKGNYKQIDSSTDFRFYVDEEVKVFSKDLKKYNGTTLEYVAIMPTTVTLKDYVESTSAVQVKNLIDNLVEIELDNFEEGYVTQIKGYIPTFEYEYKLDIVEDLKKLDITDIFDPEKADFSKLTSKKDLFINSITHKTKISFTNDGIKAAAQTSIYAGGAGGPMFDFKYDVPLKKIDLTFNKPFMYLIIDKDTQEVWFTGTVYTPDTYNASTDGIK